MVLEKNVRYMATIKLNFLESMATNEIIAGKLRDAGFAEVSVSGVGATRSANGRWAKDKTDAQLPPQVKEVKRI